MVAKAAMPCKLTCRKLERKYKKNTLNSQQGGEA